MNHLNRLAVNHQQQLKASAISDDAISQRGYRTITDPAELKAPPKPRC